jgi:hypothetical protein
MTDLDLLDIGDDEDFEDLGVGPDQIPPPYLPPSFSSLSQLSWCVGDEELEAQIAKELGDL